MPKVILSKITDAKLINVIVPGGWVRGYQKKKKDVWVGGGGRLVQTNMKHFSKKMLSNKMYITLTPIRQGP